MKRRLGKFESASAITGENTAWNIVVVIFLKGIPSPDSLRQVLDTMQDRHPFLKVRLIKEGNAYYFETGDIPPIPLTLSARESKDHWISIVEDRLNHRFDLQRGPLMTCTLLSDDSQDGEIVLTAQHAIVDGTSVELFSLELMELCAIIHTNGEIVGYEPLDPLPPVEAYFPDGYQGFDLTRKIMAYFLRQMGDEFKYQMALRGKRTPPINTNARVKILQFQTPEVLTSLLVQRARKDRVTLNSVLNAAVLLSVKKHLYNNAEMPYRYLSMADLRPYLDPPPPVHQLGSYISPMRYTIQVRNDDHLWSLARRINDQIYQSMKRGEKYLASVMSEQFLKMTFGLKKFRMSTTAISYTGSSLHPIQSYDPYNVKAIRGFVSNFGLGPEFSGIVGLYNGKLIWDMLYLDSDLDQEGAQTIAEDIQRQLDRSRE